MANNYCAVPHVYLDECEALTDEEFGRLMRALLRYSRTGEVIELAGNERFFARRLMNQEDVFNEHYTAALDRRVASARLAAMARWHGTEDADACDRIRTDAQDASTVQYRAEQYRKEQSQK